MIFSCIYRVKLKKNSVGCQKYCILLPLTYFYEFHSFSLFLILLIYHFSIPSLSHPLYSRISTAELSWRVLFYQMSSGQLRQSEMKVIVKTLTIYCNSIRNINRKNRCLTQYYIFPHGTAPGDGLMD